MNKTAHRKVVWFIFFAWILLAASVFAEGAGYCHDTDEYACQSIELSLSSPAHIESYNFNEHLASFARIAFIGIALAVTLISDSTVSKNISLLERYRPPHSPKIYQLISFYRI